jgi:adenosylmethionine-8-amino-7-oxononanoate aminotransferase
MTPHGRAGITLWDTDGNAYLDGIASLSGAVHGHRAIRDQLARRAQGPATGLGDPPGVELARRLVDLTPAGLSRVVYQRCGSESLELALTLARRCSARVGRPGRTRFICLRMSGHAAALHANELAIEAAPGDEHDMQFLLDEHADEIAAVVLEPLVQVGAGVLRQPPGYLRAVREMCDEAGVLLICDERSTGFGRTGTMFACEHEGVAPDVLCLSDGLTGGHLAFAATLMTERVHEAMAGVPVRLGEAGDPQACAGALASLEVFEREGTLARLPASIALLGDLIDVRIAPLAAVRETRRLGLLAAIRFGASARTDPIGDQVVLASRERGAIVASLGDIIVLAPPLSIGSSDLRRLVEITAASIEAVAARRLATAA